MIAAKAGRRSSETCSSGCRARRSIRTKTTKAASPAAIRPIVSSAVQPTLDARTRPNVVAAARAVKASTPARSNRPVAWLRSAPNAARVRAIATALTGRLTKKIQRQDRLSVSSPPRTGPTAAEAPGHRAPDTECCTPVTALVGGIQQGDGGGEHGGTPDALHSAGRDQQAGTRSQAAGQRRGREHGQAGQVDPPAAVQVGQRAQPHQQGGQGHRVAVDHPLQGRERGVQVNGHVRQCDVDDGHVHQQHESAEADRGQRCPFAHRRLLPAPRPSRAGARSRPAPSRPRVTAHHGRVPGDMATQTGP